MDFWFEANVIGRPHALTDVLGLTYNQFLILADEPTGALDSRTGESILALFQSLNQSGRTIVMVTHDEHIAHHARRILRLQDGALVGDEPVAHPKVVIEAKPPEKAAAA